MSIGDRIKEKRMERGWSQRDLSARMGYATHSTLARIEVGEVDVTYNRIEQFAKVLGCSIAYLMEQTEAQTPHIGEKILKRRAELGLTQEELAERMGYKSKSSINKIELGLNDIPQTKVARFAEVLGCSVAYLMGVEESPIMDDARPRNIEIFSRNLKYYIEKSGESRGALAEAWGFPYSTVSEWINGKKYPRINHIEIIAAYFGIQKSDLIEERSAAAKETQRHTDGLQDIVDHMQHDDLFYDVVKRIHEFDRQKLKGLRQLLQ